MNSFKRFCGGKLPDNQCFKRSLKDGTTGDNGVKLNGHITDGEILTYNKIWNEFNMKNIDDYHDHYLKKRCFVISRGF